MCDIMVLAKDASEITAAEEDRATAVMTLETWLLPEVRSNSADLDGLRPNQTVSSGLIAVHIAETWAQVALPEVSVRQ